MYKQIGNLGSKKDIILKKKKKIVDWKCQNYVRKEKYGIGEEKLF